MTLACDWLALLAKKNPGDGATSPGDWRVKATLAGATTYTLSLSATPCPDTLGLFYALTRQHMPACACADE